MDKLTFDAIHYAVKGLYGVGALDHSKLKALAELAIEDGFNEFKIESGHVTFWRETDRRTMEVSISDLRGYSRHLTDEELQMLKDDLYDN